MSKKLLSELSMCTSFFLENAMLVLGKYSAGSSLSAFDPSFSKYELVLEESYMIQGHLM